MAIVFIGIDFAKDVVARHWADENGPPALFPPSVPRASPHNIIASVPR